MSASRECSECGRRTRYLEGAGRPRETCSLKCRRARVQRIRREKEAWEAQTIRDAEYLAEFGKWARGEREYPP